MKRVLIVSHVDDIHSFAVARCVRELGFDAQVFDSASFPKDWTIATRLDQNKVNCCLTKIDSSTSIDLSDFVGIWWRRPNDPDLATLVSHPSYRRFAMAECDQALTGSLVACIPNFINPIHSSRKANRKIEQLAAASQLGLRIPSTLVTSNPDEARSFYKTVNSRCIYKPFTGCDFGLFETRMLANADFDDLWRLRTCPTIFQEHIEGDYDLRVTIVGRALFPAKLLFRQGRHPVDSRVDRVPIEPTELPSQIATKLLQLVDYFGLVYAAIDLRYSAREGYTFFELNPEGQFLWIEIETGLKISAALAAMLVRDPTERAETSRWDTQPYVDMIEPADKS
jgi:hypothetical protein